MDFTFSQIIVTIIWIVIGGLVGYLAGRVRGREVDGILLGIFLGPLGWLIVLCREDARPKCTECLGVVIEGARKCLHCGSDIDQTIGFDCPACGERGYVRKSILPGPVECPACKKIFTYGP